MENTKFIEYVICFWEGENWIGRVNCYTETKCAIEWFKVNEKKVYRQKTTYYSYKNRWMDNNNPNNFDSAVHFNFLTKSEYEIWEVMNA